MRIARKKTRKERLEDRVPTQVRSLWREVSSETSERRPRGLQQAAWGLLRLHIERQGIHKLDRVAKMGRAPKHQPALRRIEATKIDGETSGDPRRWLEALRKEYRKKWKAHSEHGWMNILNRSLEGEGQEMNITDADTDTCWHRIARRTVVREDGVCVEMWRMLDETARGTLQQALQGLLASTQGMRGDKVVARAGGKKTSAPAPEEMWVIIPGNSIIPRTGWRRRTWSSTWTSWGDSQEHSQRAATDARWQQSG